MMRYALPGLANNWQVILKSTALVSLIGLTDVVKAAQEAGEGTFRVFFFTSIAGLVYLFLSSISKLVQYYLTKKFSVGVRQVVF
jgi:histidine transport system permease protein